MIDQQPLAPAGRAAPLRFQVTLGYGAGQFFEGVINTTLSIFLMFYLTAVCGMPGGLAGAALSIGIIVDAVVDPVIGALSDGWRSRLGRRLPFMLAGLPPAAASFVLIFALPTKFGHWALFAWVAILSITLRVAMSLFILPYQAVGAELSDDYNERSRLMAWRWGIGMLGALLSIVVGFGLFLSGPGGLTHRTAYVPMAVTLTGVFLVASLLSIKTIHISRTRLHAPAARSGGRFGMVKAWLELFRNRSFKVLFVGALLFFISQGVSTSLALHANTYFWRLTPSQTQFVTLGLYTGLLLGAPLAGALAARAEKRTILIAGIVGLLSAEGGPVGIRLCGLLPLSGNALAWLLAVVMFVAGVLLAAAAIAFASMLADAADEHEHLFGQRREGLFFAGWLFASKSALGVGALIAGIVLQVIHFPTDLAAHGAASVALPARVSNMIAVFYGPGAAVILAGAGIICCFYRLDKRAHASILLSLAARRALSSGLPQLP